MRRVRTIDAEVAGEAVRLIVEGGPSVPGRTMMEKLAWLRKSGEELRQVLMLEPRGHAGMHGALFTEPVSPGAHAGLLSMHAAGFPVVSGEGVIGAVTLALENRLIEGVDSELRIDTPAGLVRAAPRRDGDRVSSVALTLVPSFVHTPALPVQTATRKVMVDIAFGGELYAIADSEATGIPVDMSNESKLAAHGTRDQGRHRLETAGSRHDFHRGAARVVRSENRDGPRWRRAPPFAGSDRHGGATGRARRDGAGRR